MRKIWIDDATKEKLDSIKRKTESYDDTILELIRFRKKHQILDSLDNKRRDRYHLVSTPFFK